MALGFSRKHDIEDVLGVMIKIVCVPLLLAGRCYKIENSAPLEILFAWYCLWLKSTFSVSAFLAQTHAANDIFCY